MTAQSTKQWGLTPPISTALPTPGDLSQNAALVEELKRQNNYEAAPETQKRQNTLQLLQNITVEFVKEVSRRKGYPESQVAQFGGRIYPYGSYRLGVFGPGVSTQEPGCFLRRSRTSVTDARSRVRYRHSSCGTQARQTRRLL
jgi:poly(A) polymerase